MHVIVWFCANQNQAIKYFLYLLFLPSYLLSSSFIIRSRFSSFIQLLFTVGNGRRLAHVLMLPMILLVVGLLKLSLDVFVSDFLFIYLIIRVFNVARSDFLKHIHMIRHASCLTVFFPHSLSLTLSLFSIAHSFRKL